MGRASNSRDGPCPVAPGLAGAVVGATARSTPALVACHAGGGDRKLVHFPSHRHVGCRSLCWGMSCVLRPCPWPKAADWAGLAARRIGPVAGLCAGLGAIHHSRSANPRKADGQHGRGGGGAGREDCRARCMASHNRNKGCKRTSAQSADQHPHRPIARRACQGRACVGSGKAHAARTAAYPGGI